MFANKKKLSSNLIYWRCTNSSSFLPNLFEISLFLHVDGHKLLKAFHHSFTHLFFFFQLFFLEVRLSCKIESCPEKKPKGLLFEVSQELTLHLFFLFFVTELCWWDSISQLLSLEKGCKAHSDMTLARLQHSLVHPETCMWGSIQLIFYGLFQSTQPIPFLLSVLPQ